MWSSIILLLLALLVRADAVITGTVYEENDHVHEHTEAGTRSNVSSNVPQQRRRLQVLKSLESNPQFFTPLQQSQQQQLSLESSNVFGLLFNVRSKVDDRIQITGIEFYTAQVDRVFYYQLYTKEGEFWETTDDGNGVTVKGGPDTYELISQGTIRGSENCTDSFQDTALYCTLAVVPEEVFVESQWTISEKLQSRSFFLTLASKNLVVQRSAPTQQQVRAGERVVASTPELELYGGIGTNAFPVTRDSEYLYGASLGFVGKIHYVNDDPQLAPGVPPQPSSTTTQQPTQSPTPVKTSPNTTATQQPTQLQISTQTLPTLAPQSSPTATPPQPTPSPTPIGTSSPTSEPRPKCRPGRPCLNPPQPDTEDSVSVTDTPTTSPTMTIRTIVYIENTAGRPLGPNDRSKYIEVMTKFLDQSTSLKSNDVTTMNITVVNDDLIEEPEDKKKGSGRLGGSRNLNKKGPLPNNSINTTGSYSYSYNELGGQYVPKTYPAIFVQTEFDLMSKLPYDVAAFYLWNEFRTNEEELITQFHDNSLFISYFRDIQNVTVQMVNELIAPTAAPTIVVENTTIIGSENSVQQSFENIWVYLGITVGIIWFILTCCSLRHILNHRRGQRYRQDLRRLTYQISFGSRNRERITMKMLSPKELVNRLSSVLTRSKHRNSDEENSPSDGESIESFG